MSIVRVPRGRGRQLLTAGIAASLITAVALQWPAIRSFDWSVSWLPFVTAMCLFALGPFISGLGFWVVLRGLVPHAPLGGSLLVWERSFAARYVPAGVLHVAVRLAERERLRASRSQMLGATVFEYLVALASAAAVALAALVVSGESPPSTALVVLAVVLVAVALTRPAVAWWARRRAAGGRGDAAIEVVPLPSLVAAFAIGVAGWLVVGAAATVFVASLTGDDAPGYAFLAGAYALAWIVGFVVPFAPSGLGAREAALVALLAPRLGVAPATAVTVALRLASVAGDLVAISLIEGSAATARRRARARRAGVSACEAPS